MYFNSIGRINPHTVTLQARSAFNNRPFDPGHCANIGSTHLKTVLFELFSGTLLPTGNNPPGNHLSVDYNENEGWERLAKGNADYALDIFAVQSQQNLNSGKPKVGFAIAAATMGEKERANRAMRKAVRIDANTLNSVDINTIEPTIKQLTENYQPNKNNTNDTDNSFMMATLPYLKQDYATANTLIAENDQSQSANKLRELLKSKL